MKGRLSSTKKTKTKTQTSGALRHILILCNFPFLQDLDNKADRSSSSKRDTGRAGFLDESLYSV